MQRSNQQTYSIAVWVFATVVGVLIGILSTLTLVTGLALTGAATVLIGSIGGAALGGVLGAAQWLVVRRHFPSAVWWIVASAAGGILGVAVGTVVSEALRPLIGTFLDEATRSRSTGSMIWGSSAIAGGVAGSVIGVALGTAQWLVLRRHFPSAQVWIVASWLGWMCGLTIGAGLLDLVGIFGSLLIIGIFSGVTTGAVLAKLVSGSTIPSSSIVGT